MDDSGFEEDQVQLLAELSAQALLHQPAPAAGDQLQLLLERLLEAPVPAASAAYLYGYTLCIGETLRYLAEREGLAGDHPVVCGVRDHMLAEYGRMVRHLSQTEVKPGPAGGLAPPPPPPAPSGDARHRVTAAGAGPPPNSGDGAVASGDEPVDSGDEPVNSGDVGRLDCGDAAVDCGGAGGPEAPLWDGLPAPVPQQLRDL
ncbi:hypothetical protein FJT64_000176 [Amphibalanus amphitrite]|uniref:Uncharacterized protein n=1 Tax=Amphibalanus amphitrite TaxID=1232801 RepID=A0A6A4V5Q9_AMPAM|nr:hypothetical protein FJT64_012653 [Amphibalanus amphitrite]KAF0289640.1 hypothetical protein FJT64_000176 [Amphibalanus amphitrite]